MVSFRRLDAFTKTRPDLQQKSFIGGLITIIASSTAILLFIGQIVLYIRGDSRHSLSLSKSISVPLIPLEHSHVPNNNLLQSLGKFSLYIHVTFPHISCDKLDVMHDGASLSTGELEKIHGSHTLILRKPTLSEIKKAGERQQSNILNKGCTIIGRLQPYIVAGSVSITLNMHSWSEATTAISIGLRDPNSVGSFNMQQYNVSHHIHSIRFGHILPKITDKPLEDLSHIIQNDFYGIAVSQTQVKLIPTTSIGTFFNEQMYQMSVVDITVQPQTLVSNGAQQLPGLTVSYDFTPLTVHRLESREPILVFISSLISIFSGVFVTVGMLTGCLVHSAKVVTKKLD